MILNSTIATKSRKVLLGQPDKGNAFAMLQEFFCWLRKATPTLSCSLTSLSYSFFGSALAAAAGCNDDGFWLVRFFFAGG